MLTLSYSCDILSMYVAKERIRSCKILGQKFEYYQSYNPIDFRAWPIFSGRFMHDSFSRLLNLHNMVTFVNKWLILSTIANLYLRILNL